MKIGIFVHSQSGHTSTLGLAIVHKLREKAHDVDIELLRSVKHARPFMRHVELKKVPDINDYDVVVFGGPAWLTHPSPLLLSFIDEIPHLKNKKAFCFVITALPGGFSCGKGALKKLNAKLDALGATVLEGEIHWWGLWPDKKRMELAAQKICDGILS